MEGGLEGLGRGDQSRGAADRRITEWGAGGIWQPWGLCCWFCPSPPTTSTQHRCGAPSRPLQAVSGPTGIPQQGVPQSREIS